MSRCSLGRPIPEALEGETGRWQQWANRLTQIDVDATDDLTVLGYYGRSTEEYRWRNRERQAGRTPTTDDWREEREHRRLGLPTRAVQRPKRRRPASLLARGVKGGRGKSDSSGGSPL